MDPYPDYGGTVYAESEGGLVRVLRADERITIHLDLIVNAAPGAISVEEGLLVLGNDPEGQVGYRLVAYDPTSRMFAAQLVHGIKGQPRGLGVSGQRPDVVVTEGGFRDNESFVTGEGSVTE